MTLPCCLEFSPCVEVWDAQILQQEFRAVARPQSSTKYNFVLKMPKLIQLQPSQSQAVILIPGLLQSWRLTFVFMHSEEKEKLSLNTLIHALKSTEKYSTNNKTNRCIRKFSNRASAGKNLYLQIFMKNMEQMFLHREFRECKSQREAMVQPTFPRLNVQ